jgi:hypothetical protein
LGLDHLRLVSAQRVLDRLQHRTKLGAPWRSPRSQAQAEEGRLTVLIYVNTSKQVGDPEHIKVFADQDAAEKWFEENDPEGVAFEYEVLE